MRTKVINRLNKGGFNSNDVNEMVEQWFDTVVSWGSYTTPAQIADVVSSLWAQN